MKEPQLSFRQRLGLEEQGGIGRERDFSLDPEILEQLLARSIADRDDCDLIERCSNR
jgi:hypothetical protein